VIVQWDAYAEEDWRRLSLDDAERVAVAVHRWAQSGVGLVDVAEAGRVYRLYVAQPRGTWSWCSFSSMFRPTRCT
jgi:hypothetical protein